MAHEDGSAHQLHHVSPDAKVVAAGDNDANLAFWDPPRTAELHFTAHTRWFDEAP